MILFKRGTYFPDRHVCILTRWVIFLDIAWVVSIVRKYIRGGAYPHDMEPRLNFRLNRLTNLDFEKLLRFGAKTKYLRRIAKLIWKFFAVWNQDFFVSRAINVALLELNHTHGNIQYTCEITESTTLHFKKAYS